MVKKKDVLGSSQGNQLLSVIRRRLVLGDDLMRQRDEQWPRSAVGTSDVARKAVAATNRTGLP